jgi:hypothetical protein
MGTYSRLLTFRHVAGLTRQAPERYITKRQCFKGVNQMVQIMLAISMLFVAFAFSAEAGEYRTCDYGCGAGSGSSHQGAHYNNNGE